jgi:hypothetical protein
VDHAVGASRLLGLWQLALLAPLQPGLTALGQAALADLVSVTPRTSRRRRPPAASNRAAPPRPPAPGPARRATPARSGRREGGCDSSQASSSGCSNTIPASGRGRRLSLTRSSPSVNSIAITSSRSTRARRDPSRASPPLGRRPRAPGLAGADSPVRSMKAPARALTAGGSSEFSSAGLLAAPRALRGASGSRFRRLGGRSGSPPRPRVEAPGLPICGRRWPRDITISTGGLLGASPATLASTCFTLSERRRRVSSTRGSGSTSSPGLMTQRLDGAGPL